MASRIANVEALESRGRVLEIFRREARDGGGAGRFRGGAGVQYAVIAAQARPARRRLLTRSSGVEVPGGRGLAGGLPGAPVSQRRAAREQRPRALRAPGGVPLGAGDLDARARPSCSRPRRSRRSARATSLIAATPGGGGYGDPLRRDPRGGRARRRGRAGLGARGAARSTASIAPGGALDGGADRAPARGDPRAPPRRVAGAAAGARPGARRPPGRRRDQRPTATACAARSAAGRSASYDADQQLIGTVRELPLRALGERFARCLPGYVLREQSCPGCGTALATDIAAAGEGAPGATRLRAGS